jgi:hypothetical protein
MAGSKGIFLPGVGVEAGFERKGSRFSLLESGILFGVCRFVRSVQVGFIFWVVRRSEEREEGF